MKSIYLKVFWTICITKITSAPFHVQPHSPTRQTHFLFCSNSASPILRNPHPGKPPGWIDMSRVVEEYADFRSLIEAKNFVGLKESRALSKFAMSLRDKSANKDFIRHVFSNGFCELPPELIEAFEQEADIQWGGVWGYLSNVDYMHFEIRHSSISKYLSQKKP